MEAAWVEGIRDQCLERGVAFFFKQWGGVRKGEAGRELEGRVWDEMPAMTDGQLAVGSSILAAQSYRQPHVPVTSSRGPDGEAI